jgi:hypothetical protein
MKRHGGLGSMHRLSLAHYHRHAETRYDFNRAKKQHAIDEMARGSTLLRSPQNEVEESCYKSANKPNCHIYRTSSGQYFTTLKPMPEYLRPLVIEHTDD